VKLFYYLTNFAYNALPSIYFKQRFNQLKQYEKICNKEALNKRLNYYCKINSSFALPEVVVAIKNFRRTKGTGYYFDLKEFLHYLEPDTKLAYVFGDDTYINSYPTIIKARPIIDDNANSVLFKLNKRRHFKWVNDNIPFWQKQNKLVWRGGAYWPLRRNFVEKFYKHPLCNVGQTNKPKEDVPWQKSFMSIVEQLQYKFILCLEGNDVATNLKWVLSSNSLCFMPKPKFETWFMEGTLVAGKHYIELDADYKNLEDMIVYYSKNIQEAQNIINEANQYVKQFQNKMYEDLLCLKVLEKYAQLSGQADALKFI